MAQFTEWWESINPREQQLAMVSAVFIVIAILYLGIWSPLSDQLNTSKEQLTKVENTLAWTQDNATIVLNSSGSTPVSGRKLTKILNQTARQNNITFSRIVNKKEKIEVWITEVEFDAFVNWTAELSNKHGVAVLNADLAKTDRAGYIKINRLLLGN